MKAPAKILLIEDEPGLLRTLSDLLRSKGHAVDSASDGARGLELASKGAFDLVILDVMLPSMSGFEVCRKLRQSHVATPVLMLTARGDTHDKVLGLNIGADDYLTKPFEMPELLARIDALLRRASGAIRVELRTYEFGNTQVDFVKSQVHRKNQTIELSERECRLLRYFIEHRDAVISREELLHEVWGYNAAPYSRTVDVHVAWLRQKIEDDPKEPRYLVTAYGQGYRFSG